VYVSSNALVTADRKLDTSPPSLPFRVTCSRPSDRRLRPKLRLTLASGPQYAPQQYNAYYSQCMAARTPPPPSYYPSAPAYAPAQGYAPRPSSSANDLNRQQLNQLTTAPQ
jgi:hypothetical protein